MFRQRENNIKICKVKGRRISNLKSSSGCKSGSSGISNSSSSVAGILIY